MSVLMGDDMGKLHFIRSGRNVDFWLKAAVIIVVIRRKKKKAGMDDEIL